MLNNKNMDRFGVVSQQKMTTLYDEYEICELNVIALNWVSIFAHMDLR